jgi:hypothetical protein
VRFWSPFDDFATPPVPRDVDTYLSYVRRSDAFVDARNRRIGAWSAARTVPSEGA